MDALLFDRQSRRSVELRYSPDNYLTLRIVGGGLGLAV